MHKDSVSGLHLAKLLCCEFSTFFTQLNAKLEAFVTDEETLSPNDNAKAKDGRKKAKGGEKRKRLRTPFNLFVREVIKKEKAKGTIPPEGVRQSGWLMSVASKKWSEMSSDQKQAYALSVKDELDNENSGSVANTIISSDTKVSPMTEDKLLIPEKADLKSSKKDKKRKKKKKHDAEGKSV